MLVTIRASVNDGYAFIGWYKEDELVTKELSYAFNVPVTDVEYEARYVEYSLILTKNIDKVGSVSFEGYKIIGKEITITASNVSDKYLIWYFNDVPTYLGNSYTFNMLNVDLVIKLMTVDSLESIGYTKNENKIYFGKYPPKL